MEVVEKEGIRGQIEEISEEIEVACETVLKWELLVYTPGVCVRVANTGVRSYGKQKSVKRKGLDRHMGRGISGDGAERLRSGRVMEHGSRK